SDAGASTTGPGAISLLQSRAGRPAPSQGESQALPVCCSNRPGVLGAGSRACRTLSTPVLPAWSDIANRASQAGPHPGLGWIRTRTRYRLHRRKEPISASSLILRVFHQLPLRVITSNYHIWFYSSPVRIRALPPHHKTWRNADWVWRLIMRNLSRVSRKMNVVRWLSNTASSLHSLPLASSLRHEDLDLRSARPSIWSQPRSRARSLRTSHEHSSQPC